MLIYIILTPVIGSIILGLISDETINERIKIKQISLIVSLLTFFLTINVWIQYDSSQSDYQFIQSFTKIGFCHINIGIDSLNLYYIILTSLLIPICILASWHNIAIYQKYYFIFLLIVETLLLTVFIVLDILLFYIFFEASLVPLFLIVGIWGSSNTRIRAAFLLFLYTLAGSLFILISIVIIAYNIGTTDYKLLSLSNISFKQQQLIWIGFFIAFAVKTPLIPFHIWLPRAHAEAPLAGSILLAGVVLKIASYGILRIQVNIFPDASNYYSPLIQTIAIISIIYSGLAAIRQIDTKALVAYSSISHIGVIVLGIFSNNLIGIEGAYLLTLAHGIVSPIFFILVGGILYDRYHTRYIKYYRGLFINIPIFSILFFIISCANIAVPLSLNWIGEFIALSGSFQRSIFTTIIASSSIILSACYTIWLWNRIVGGSISYYLKYTLDITRREFIILLPILIITILFGIIPSIITTDLHINVTNLLYTITT